MILSGVFKRFAELTPACVMHRALLENFFSEDALNELFRKNATKQYERELMFSTVVDVIGKVVSRVKPSVNACYVDQKAEIPVSAKAFYDKLTHIETSTSRALVRHTAERAAELVDLVGARRKPLLAGYRTRILDGNHLAKSEHRLGVLRNTSAGPLPGQTLALLNPELMLIEDIFVCEDGHAQERSLLPHILLFIEHRDLLICDRNFCTLKFIFGLLKRKASYVIRRHARMPYSLVGKRKYKGKCETGRVYEQTAELCDPESGEITHVRLVTIELDKPTQDGDTEIDLLTNLPEKKASALYRSRWKIEHAFFELTEYLKCELNTLGYPKAALFAFCVAVSIYNLMSTMKAALRGVHGEKVVDEEVSDYYLFREISETYTGMMVAIPPEEWIEFQKMSSTKLGKFLIQMATKIDLDKYPKSRRGPKQPKKKLANSQFRHVSTAKLLNDKAKKLREENAKVKKAQQKKVKAT
jgi:hypothetical protein